MKTRERLGLMLLMWLARYLLKGGITQHEADELKALATSLSVSLDWERMEERP